MVNYDCLSWFMINYGCKWYSIYLDIAGIQKTSVLTLQVRCRSAASKKVKGLLPLPGPATGCNDGVTSDDAGSDRYLGAAESLGFWWFLGVQPRAIWEVGNPGILISRFPGLKIFSRCVFDTARFSQYFKYAKKGWRPGDRGMDPHLQQLDLVVQLLFSGKFATKHVRTCGLILRHHFCGHVYVEIQQSSCFWCGGCHRRLTGQEK